MASPGGKDRPLLWPSALFAALITLILAFSGLPGRLDLAFYDAFSHLRLAADAQLPESAPVIVAIDPASLKGYGRWPWPRSLLARLAARINSGEPAAVALDFLLTEPAPGDEALAEALSAGNYVLAERLALTRDNRGRIKAGQSESPIPSLSAVSQSGFIDFFPDADGVARRMLLAARADGEDRRSLALALAQAAKRYGGEPGSPEILLTIGLRTTDFDVIPAGAVLDGAVDPGRWRGRPVIVGLTAPGLTADQYPVAVRPLGLVPGAFLHAYVYSTLTAWGAIKLLPPSVSYLLALAASIILLWFGWRRRPWSTALGWLILSLFTLALSGGLFLGGYWAGPSLALFALISLASALLIENAAFLRRREARLRANFSRYVSPAAMREILAAPEPVLGGESREITVLFADLRGFTAFAATRPPAAVAHLLNQHLDLIARAILAHGGMVDKFIGDAVMGVFGAPLSQSDQSNRALAAAEEILRQLAQPGFLAAGIGLARGIAVVGNIGGHERLEYTAIGGPVNIAARLEEMAGPGEILVTAECLADRDPNPGWTPLPGITLRGLSEPILLYRRVMRITADFITQG